MVKNSRQRPSCRAYSRSASQLPAAARRPNPAPPVPAPPPAAPAGPAAPQPGRRPAAAPRAPPARAPLLARRQAAGCRSPAAGRVVAAAGISHFGLMRRPMCTATTAEVRQHQHAAATTSRASSAESDPLATPAPLPGRAAAAGRARARSCAAPAASWQCQAACAPSICSPGLRAGSRDEVDECGTGAAGQSAWACATRGVGTGLTSAGSSSTGLLPLDQRHAPSGGLWVCQDGVADAQAHDSCSAARIQQLVPSNGCSSSRAGLDLRERGKDRHTSAHHHDVRLNRPPCDCCSARLSALAAVRCSGRAQLNHYLRVLHATDLKEPSPKLQNPNPLAPCSSRQRRYTIKNLHSTTNLRVHSQHRLQRMGNRGAGSKKHGQGTALGRKCSAWLATQITLPHHRPPPPDE
jgi:hypothetical protein